ncbi:MAG: hypothetical protein HQL25_01335 [Candidatus Omnitrophica bacterium]|nr:hypothetical protein [Candidatus Omnitrophota bacterium]
MAYKQEVVVCLEDLLDTENEVLKHFARQDIFLMIMPKLIGQSVEVIRWKLKELLDEAEKQRDSIEDLLLTVKEEVSDVY